MTFFLAYAAPKKLGLASFYVGAFRDAPFIPRPGQVNAWNNEEFVTAVKATGRRQLLIAGVVTDVCVTFPTLSALAEGYDLFVVPDASWTFNAAVRKAA
jgi:nicotinamidase-related amidase